MKLLNTNHVRENKLWKLAGALFLAVFFAWTGCSRLPAPNPSTKVTNFKDLTVSPTFNWATTKKVAVNVTVPSWAPYQPLKIYSYDNKVLYYAGFPDASGQVSAQITVPSATNMLKLVYGRGNLFKSVLTGIDNQLLFNYNSFKDAKANPCDLSGEVSYSQGGWSSKPHGKNPGSILKAHFDDVFPHGLVVGDSSHYTIKLTSAEAVQAFLPGGGHSKVLTQSYQNPVREHGKHANRYGGSWAGQIVAAEINVAMARAGYIGTNSIKLGDLVFTGGTAFDGMTVNDFLKLANQALGGGGLNGYTIKNFQVAAELVNINFDEGDKNEGYFTCASAGAACGCKGGLNSLSLKFVGNASAKIIVKAKGSNVEYYNGTVSPDDTITIRASTGKRLKSNVDFYVNGLLNTTIHTSCSVNLYKGDKYGDFMITDGTSKNDLHLCENPNGSSCGCDSKLYSLTLRYDGNGTARVKVKEEDHGCRIYSGVVSNGDEFSFNGTDDDGSFPGDIYVYENGSKNTTIGTSCSDHPIVGKKYGDFTIMGGTSKGNLALCDTTGGGGSTGGGGTIPPAGTTTSIYSGSLAFEDLWPYQGDYDMNDVVVGYNFATTMDDQNRVQSMTATFILYASGAFYDDGFGFQLPNVLPNQVISVTGSNLASNTYIHLASNGLEANQSKATMIVFDDAFRLMPSPGGIGVNTQMDEPYITPDTIVLNIIFYKNGSFAPGGAVTYDKLNIGNFNPFIIVNKNRGVEVHLRDDPPTDLADKTLFGTGDDASNPANGTYYVTSKNLPWAINIPIPFQYPIEKQDILGAYLHFADWAESDGILFPAWYADKPGYRDASLIYKPH